MPGTSPPSQDPNSLAEAALKLCFEQKEIEAAQLIKDLPYDSEASKVHDLLACHFASREALSNRLKVDDPIGAKWAKTYGYHPNFIPRCYLSATIIVKNEEAHITRCLKSLEGIVDEVVLVDTGSTDRTLRLVRYLNVPHLRLHKFEWTGSFSDARNYALDQACGDWALWIDADEELTAESAAAIHRAIIRPHYGGFNIQIINYTDDLNLNETYTHAPVRLFKHSPVIKFVGKIHEQIANSIEQFGLKIATLEGAKILHYGYRPSEMVKKDKVTRFITMLEQEVKESPSNGFQWFNLANAYCVAGKTIEQEHAAKMAVHLLPNNDQSLSLAFQLLASSQTALGRPDEAIASVEEANTRGIHDLFSTFELANALITQGQFEGALTAINECMEFNWTTDTIGDYTMFQYKRYVVKGQVLNGLGQYKEAIKELDYALKVQPEFQPAIFHRAASLLGLGKFEKALAGFQRLTQTGTLIGPALMCSAKCQFGLKKWSESSELFEKAFKWDMESFTDWLAWAEAAERSGDAVTISRAFEAFAEQPEPSHSVLINWGRSLAKSGDHQRALDCFSEALKLAPDDANAHFNCGDLLYKLGQFQDAAHLYQSGLEIEPKNAEGWFVFGNSLAMLSFSDAASVAYQETLKLSPKHPGALHNLSTLQAAA